MATATIMENGQSYLEKEAIDLRREQAIESRYKSKDIFGSEALEYNADCDDAKWTGDSRGKGTGDLGGAKWIRPDMSINKNQRSGQYNTEDAGNDCDHNLRNAMTARSIYGPGREYGAEDGNGYKVDTKANRLQGQFDNGAPIPLTWSCPVI